MTQEEIKKILPHRDKMLLVDEAELCQDSLDENGQPTRCRGSYTIRGDEWFLQGHFPGNPIVPGVIQCEMIAQTAVLLVPDGRGKMPVYTGMNNVRFKHPLLPGDTAIMRVRLTARKGVFYFAEGTLEAGGKLCTRAEFSFALITKKEENAAK